jgi:hypothetical protein
LADIDLPRTAAYRAVFDVGLSAVTALVDLKLDGLAAVRAIEREGFGHGAQL